MGLMKFGNRGYAGGGLEHCSRKEEEGTGRSLRALGLEYT